MEAEQQDKVAQFSAVTGANPSIAQTALSSANWNLEEAVALYFAASDDPQHDHDEDFDADEPANQPTSSSANPTRNVNSVNPDGTDNVPHARKPPGQRGRQPVTLRDLQGATADDDDDEDEDKPRDLFAGGEKSGLAVQDPSKGGGGPIDHFKNIMNQARQNRDRPGGPGGDEEEGQAGRTSAFTGRAQTLGGDDAPSQVIADPNAPAAGPQGGRQALPHVTRTLHLWADGVSIDDGPLFRFDDPANQDIMQQINQGRAPLSLLDVQPDQEVDLNLDPHKDENYVKPKQKYKPFGGQGQRLGSPTPGPAPSSSSARAAPPAQPATTTSQQSGPAQMQVDEAAPTVQLQIRLGDGTQLRSRFNTAHTIGDVYEFVNRASPASTQRPYALMTTFPSKELSDKSQVLGEMSDYKRGGVVVQKWT